MSAQKPSANISKGLNTSKDAGKLFELPKIVRTAAVRLEMTAQASAKLLETQKLYGDACRILMGVLLEGGREERRWQRYALHHAGYRIVRAKLPNLGSQCVCNAIRSVSGAVKSWISNHPKFAVDKTMAIPTLSFRNPVVHLDKNTITYGKVGNEITATIYSIEGRVPATLRPGPFQAEILASGKWAESNLVHRRGGRGKPDYWELHIAVEKEAAVPALENLLPEQVMGVDVGENNMAAISSGRIWKAGKLKHDRDRYLAVRSRLQRNGSRSAKQHLREASRRERRRTKHVNNVVSKEIVEEARQRGVRLIVLEDLTNIRERIKAGKRVRTRLHRRPFRELQQQILQKAARTGIRTMFVDPRYTSQTCNRCKALAKRRKHLLVCQCGNRAHADVNASRNLRDLGCLLAPKGRCKPAPDVEPPRG